MIILRILFDIFIIMLGLVIVIGFLSLKPVRMPIIITPNDLGMDFEAVAFFAKDKMRLSGWFIPGEKTRGTIICCHGYPANKSDILPTISFLHSDFNLFLFDFRGHGESGGKITTFGMTESRDVWAAIDWLKNRPATKDKPIGIWGYSLGGAVAILSASKTTEIKAIVTDSAYADFPDMVARQYRFMGPAKYPMTFLSNLLSRILIKEDLSSASPEKVIGEVRLPILIIHSGRDEITPVSHAHRLYGKANQPKEIWILSTGSHTDVGSRDMVSYESKVKEFFIKTMKDSLTKRNLWVKDHQE